MRAHNFIMVDVKKKTHARETVGFNFTPFPRPQEAIDERGNAAPGAVRPTIEGDDIIIVHHVP
jgi:hypothetical protein